MSSETYNALTAVLLFGGLIAAAASVGYFVAAVIGWRGPARKRRLVAAAVLAAVFPIAVVAQQVLLHRVFLPSLGREAEQAVRDRTDAASVVAVGDPAPSFVLTTADGVPVALDELRGKVVLLNFFATWCGPCLQELPHVQALWDARRGRDDFALLVVGREETDASVAAFRAEHGYSFPIAADPDRSAYSLYAKELIPRTYLIGRDGAIRFASVGFSAEEFEELERELEKQLHAPESP